MSVVDDGAVVATTSGPVRGSREGSVASWKGIRYAAPPTGARRWRAPVAPEPWTEVRDAVAFGPAAPQMANAVIHLGDGVTQDEDCLFLNVWAPVVDGEDRPRPVMVWIHGGAYFVGSASQAVYDARSLVENGDVVIVTLNYRLGALGFVDARSLAGDGAQAAGIVANPALHDILFALAWVRDNIAAFGGDPDAVTVFGESAGGGCVTTLLAVPAAEGLFVRAIAESSPVTSVYDAERAAGVARLLAEKVGVEPGDLTALEGLPVDRLVAAASALYTEVPVASPGVIAFAPVVDGDLIPEHPITAVRAGRGLPVPLLIGTNKDEASLFRRMKSPLMPIEDDTILQMFRDIAEEQPGLVIPERAQVLSAYSGLPAKAIGAGVARDIGFRMPTVWLAEAHAAVAPVWLYRFDWAPPMLHLLGIGASHATELPYVWGNLSTGPRDITFRLGGRHAGRALSARMQHRWLSFATDGRPAGLEGDPEWPAYDPGADRATLVIDKADRVVGDLDGELRRAWGDTVLSFL